MSFNVPAEQDDAFMGRYSAPLAPVFADFAGVSVGSAFSTLAVARRTDR